MLRAADDQINVQILCINDFHGSLLQTEEVSKRPVGGAANLAAWLKDRERTNPITYLVHAGDMIGASQPLSGLLQDEPAMDFLNSLGFDVGVPGNHEFDEGLAELLRLQQGGYHKATGTFHGSSFPLILANVVYAKTKASVFPPYLIKMAEDIPVAFIGVITGETPSIVMADGIRGLEFLDPAESVNRFVAELRKKEIETFIVLAHEGGTKDAKSGHPKGPIADMARKMDAAVDVVLCGHSHTMMNGQVDGKLVVQAYSKGTAFADVDLILSKKTRDVISKRAEIVTAWLGEKGQDINTVEFIARISKKVEPILERKICRSAAKITKKQNKAGESELGDLIADAQRWATDTQIVFMNPGGIRRSLPAGTITWGILYETQPFGNRLMRFTMTGEQIARLLNEQWKVDRFLQISGMRYTWSEKRPAGNRVMSMTLKDGTAVLPDGTYSVAANELLAAGKDRFYIFKEIVKKESIRKDLDALIDYLKTLKQPITVKRDGRIQRIK